MLALILAFCLPFFDTSDDLKIIVSGCKSQKGELFIALFDEEDEFPVFGR